MKKQLFVAALMLGVAGTTVCQISYTCGQLPPPGWVTTAIGNYCAPGKVLRTIKYVANMPTFTILDICGELPPAGWVTVRVNGSCSIYGVDGGRTIQKVTGAAPGTELSICGELPPAGWVTTQITGYCNSATYSASRSIKKIEGLPIGSEVTICGELPPAGWVTLYQIGRCSPIDWSVSRRIRKVSGRPATAPTITSANPTILVSPNPSTTGFAIRFAGFSATAPVDYRMMDVSGKVLQTGSCQSGTTLQVGNQLIPGIYLLEAVQHNVKSMLKLIKQ